VRATNYAGFVETNKISVALADKPQQPPRSNSLLTN
jgi:hypothetical protein